jgi:radical SAM protein with 4Fe4S-binding SPASM domain
MSSALSRPLPEFHGFGYRIAQIENNTHCNYKCWFCPNAYDKPAPKECMDIELFRKILLEIRSVYTPWELNDISFATYNEPNLDDTFKEKLQLMTDMGFQYEHISNGSMVTTELTDWLIENPQNIKQFRLNIPTMDEKRWKDMTGSSTAVLYRMYYQLMHLFENAPRLNFPITVIVNGDGSEDHKQEFMKVYQKFQRCPPGINFSMTGLIDRAGTLDGANCETQQLDRGPIDWGEQPTQCSAGYFDNLYFGVKGNVFYCCHDFHQDYSCGNINDTPLKELLSSEAYQTQKQRFQQDFCRKCEQARPLETVNEQS